MSVIEVKNLMKKFGEKVALRNVSFSIKGNEVFGYLGPNGAGKTTTIKIIMGLLKPTSGEVNVLGHNLYEANEIRQKVGVVLESHGLYERLSAYENLEYYAKIFKIGKFEKETKIKELLKLMNLWDRRHDKVGTLSAGTKQKIAIARSLLHEPQILILDEPYSGLDPESQKNLRDLIMDINKKGCTILLSSHILTEVQNTCSKVAILHQGKIIACEYIDKLIKRFTTQSYTITVENINNGTLEKICQLGFVSECFAKQNKIIIKTKDPNRLPEILNLMITEGIKIKEATKETKTLEDLYLTFIRGARNGLE